MSAFLSFFFHNSMLRFSSSPIIAAFAHSAGSQEEIARLEEDMEELIRNTLSVRTKLMRRKSLRSERESFSKWFLLRVAVK